MDSPTAAAKYPLRSLACRYRQLSKEIQDLRTELQWLIRTTAPALLEASGLGPDTAADLLVAAVSNPDRLRSEAAFASLFGVNPIPASSGRTNRHRLNRGGDRQANAALYRIVVVRLRLAPTVNTTVTLSKAAYTASNCIGCGAHGDVNAANITSSSDTDSDPNTVTLAFTPTNHYTGQTVTVTGVLDTDDIHEYLIILAIVALGPNTSSSDPYRSLEWLNGVYVTIHDWSDDGSSHGGL